MKSIRCAHCRRTLGKEVDKANGAQEQRTCKPSRVNYFRWQIQIRIRHRPRSMTALRARFASAPINRQIDAPGAGPGNLPARTNLRNPVTERLRGLRVQLDRSRQTAPQCGPLCREEGRRRQAISSADTTTMAFTASAAKRLECPLLGKTNDRNGS